MNGPPSDAADDLPRTRPSSTGAQELSAADSLSTVRAILDSAIDAIMVIDASGVVTEFSRSAERIFGWSREEAVGRLLQELVVPPENRDAHRRGVERLRAGGAPRLLDQVLQLDAVRRDGERFPAEVYITRIEQGSASAYAGFVRDISDRVAAQEALRLSEERFRAITQSIPELVVTTDAEGVIGFAGDSVELLLGYQPDDLVGRSVLELTHPEQRDLVRREAREVSAQPGFTNTAIVRLRRADGVYRLFDVESRDHRDDPAFHAIIHTGRDVTERFEVARQLRRANSRLGSLIANLQAGVLVEDEQRRVVLANEEFCRLFAIPVRPADLVGADCSAAADDAKHLFAEPERFVAGVEEALRNRQVRMGEELEFTDGRTLERDFVPIEADGEYTGHLWVYRDVTTRRVVQRDLAFARDEAVRAARVKSDFLAAMSHEIRTPMHGILATAELLRDREDLDDESRKLADIMLESARALGTILDDVLDFSKIDAGGMKAADLAPFDLGAVIGAAVELLTPAGEAKGVAVRSTIDADVPRQLFGEAGWLRQIVLNLVGNAVKFTDDGEVAVSVTGRVAKDPRMHEVQIAVRDTGCGIEPGDMARLFEPFVQADSSSRRRHGGTGLGLAITKQLCEAMGGYVQVTSAPEVGSEFVVTLPFTRANAVPEQAAEPARPDLLRGARVLVVEDNEFNREIVVRQLAALGIDAIALADGAAAVPRVVEEHWDCVLMDCHMPGMDGFETTRRIRELEGDGRRTPIVALTASALDADRQASLDAGMDDHLAKPLALPELRVGLERWISPAPGAEPGAAADPAPGMAAAARRLADELGADDAREIADMFRDQLDVRLHDMEAALAATDATRLAAVAHTLKSVSATLGAERMSELCADLENRARSGAGGCDELVEQIRAEDAAVRAAIAGVWR